MEGPVSISWAVHHLKQHCSKCGSWICVHKHAHKMNFAITGKHLRFVAVGRVIYMLTLIVQENGFIFYVA